LRALINTLLASRDINSVHCYTLWEMANYHYQPLEQSDTLPSSSSPRSSNDCEQDVSMASYQRRRERWSLAQVLAQLVPWALVLGLLYGHIRSRTWGWNNLNQHKMFQSQLSYSPAQDEVEYVLKVFEQGVDGVAGGMSPEFQGPPSDELDEAWTNLYRCECCCFDE
jgi:hypothetical protein